MELKYLEHLEASQYCRFMSSIVSLQQSHIVISIETSLLLDKQLVEHSPQTQDFYAKSLTCMDVILQRYPLIKDVAKKVEVGIRPLTSLCQCCTKTHSEEMGGLYICGKE